MISHINHVTVMSLPKLKRKANYVKDLVNMVYLSCSIAANVLFMINYYCLARFEDLTVVLCCLRL